jgi:PIN domain nuclease of toxin-antitoxin system
LTLLLDMHAVVWWLTSDRQLGRAARAAIGSSAAQPWVSVASVWEAAIKSAAGRLRLPAPPAELLSERALADAGFQTMAIRAAHALAAGALPRHHGDPFDRLLIAQAQLEDLTIVTSDAVFDVYDVKTLDART